MKETRFEDPASGWTYYFGEVEWTDASTGSIAIIAVAAPPTAIPTALLLREPGIGGSGGGGGSNRRVWLLERDGDG